MLIFGRNKIGHARVTSRLSAAVFASALCFGAALSGCGGGTGGFCDAAAECEGGNDADVDACNDRFDTATELADLKNCTSEWDEYFDCRDENARCNDDNYDSDGDTCESERERYNKCVND